MVNPNFGIGSPNLGLYLILPKLKHVLNLFYFIGWIFLDTYQEHVRNMSIYRVWGILRNIFEQKIKIVTNVEFHYTIFIYFGVKMVWKMVLLYFLPWTWTHS